MGVGGWEWAWGRGGGLNGGGESAESEKEEDCQENTVLEEGLGGGVGGVEARLAE